MSISLDIAIGRLMWDGDYSCRYDLTYIKRLYYEIGLFVVGIDKNFMRVINNCYDFVIMCNIKI